MLVVSIALTSQKFVIGQIEAIGSNLVWVELVNAGSKGQPLSYELTVDDMNAVKAVSYTHLDVYKRQIMH